MTLIDSNTRIAGIERSLFTLRYNLYIHVLMWRTDMISGRDREHGIEIRDRLIFFVFMDSEF